MPSLSVLGVGSLLALRRAMRLAPPQCLLLSIVIAVSSNYKFTYGNHKFTYELLMIIAMVLNGTLPSGSQIAWSSLVPERDRFGGPL